MNQSEVLKSEARRESLHQRSLQFLLSVVIPLASAVLGAFTIQLWDFDRGITIFTWILVFVVGGLVWWNCFPTTNSVMQLASENLDLNEQLNDAQSELARIEKISEGWALHSYSSLSLVPMIVQFHQIGIKNIEQLEEVLEEMLATLHLQGGEIFSFGASEAWNFSVYIYSKERDLLIPVWRKRSECHPSSGAGRSWGRGQGHVGKAFVDRKPIVTGDAGHPDVKQLCGAPASLEAEYDQLAYRSFASVPILAATQESPYGVLVATSDVVDRFDDVSSQLLLIHADAIGALFALNNVDIDCLR